MAENNKKDSFNFPPVGGKNNKGPKFGGYWSFIIIAAFIIGIQFFSMPSNPERISWQKFKTDLLAKGEVKDIYIVRNGGKAEITLKPEKVETHSDLVAKGFNQKSIGPQYYVPFGTLEQFEKNLQDAQKEYPEEASDVFIDYKDDFNWWGEVITLFLPIAIFVGIWIFFMRRMSKGAGGGGGGGGIFNVGKSKAKLFDKESNIKITFKDVAGLAEAKQEVEEIVSFLKSPDKYTKLGGKIPKGALLVGPPGTGKTLMAKAMAGEANVPFFSMSGSDFVEMFVGVGASRVRDLFKQAKEKAPCIIFIDEIDAIGRARGKNPNMGANDERENTLNQLLTEMDGFETNSGVIILAATNRADILDSALLRAGRFDRQIYVDLPELKDREEIFKVHLKPLKLAEDIDYAFLAKQTPGFSGADIANVANEAALIAARKNKSAVEKQDFLDSIDRIVGGLENRSKVIKPSEKKAIAYHEAGHATVSWLLQHAHPLLKVTIVPRGKALGAAWYLPQERQITTKDQLLDQMCSVLGGRAAEEIVFGEISTGAQNDLERATKQAYAMVSIYGMSDKVGMLSYYDSTGQSDFSFTKPYSEKTAELIDAEVKDMVSAAYERAKQLLSDHREQHRQVAELLIEREVIFSDDLENILGKRPWTEEEETQQPEEL
ncbi:MULTISPECIES: ATP-dependent zinc metalloprotease FtsH [Butyricimonas]|jgi:ATP-dependent metallopeptidase hflB|uniref:ATP-dependent zinc metalloprotease FtsH n=1 Tax=Butyricimonas faecihominis TaxID=1472416 RepID=A0A7W6HUT6_9BACT|nr:MULTISPECIES: ATP-dependent zinc metalloprotease FtsH [Butyricimonas]MBS6688596.1 ATP-dependent zinc metalloprotease FtsH [Sanguibacteroides justesenii]OKZ21025.1 MAG: cell division protein FtsH [Butyricimonas synergistica]KAB1509090.1 ATP-dependent metallopeptidase FtsH/Yme1/Tma family protein [Butyricimonas faecihominis]MBB4024858.1 cell division protease FtsH [Butyricimonas faecihominis]WOF08415.1 ATP-dependent metallopeptidase FtsH/Yme1/Tma family protein [Butyricimonas faecihominis]